MIKGDTFSSISSKYFSGIEKYTIKRRLRSHAKDLKPLQPWLYTFSGSMTKQDFFQRLTEWPQTNYQRVTILEWWSSYDIDDMLFEKWLIQKWGYIAYVTSGEIIKNVTLEYEFLWWTARWRVTPLKSLEWFLYPDTYNIDHNKPFLSQLVSLQLKQFENVVWQPLQSNIKNYNTTLTTLWYENIQLTRYDMLILATVIEKEERSNKNRPLIAWIFLNRLTKDMRLDADITLCYGLHQGYENCPPSVIVEHLKDENNPYNTRAVVGLPPTPIANPQLSSIQAVLNPIMTKDLFYLHDNKWYIYTAETNSEHELNKSKYLK